ncbi:MAG: phosphoribosylanthranilate isomerase [Candidatus Saccharicenans sp.]|uniref:phosphoribosylanthranilate isomerase n=1 Tax=Candidatus Saccharicenans sp. TaxID=2819258 RepID=UPI00404995EB
MTRIKICGITNLEDALLAVNLGAEALGFIFSESPRMISPDQARVIIDNLPPFTIKFGVFSNEPARRVEKIDRALELDFLQFHGDESVDYVKHFKRKGLKVFKIGEPSDLEPIISSGFDFFILDSKIKGQPFDWELAIKAKRFGRFLLGGGLNPENVEIALSRVSPFGLDVCSGIELYPGKKDPSRLRDFIRRIRKWEDQQVNLVSSEDDSFLKP